MKDWEAKLCPHLSAQVINLLLRENRKTIPKCLSVNLFKNVSLHILNFIPVSYLIKISPNGKMLNFLCFFILFNAVKTNTNLTLHHMGIFFYYLTFQDKIKIWRVTFKKKSFLLLKQFRIDFRFHARDDLPRAHWDETEFGFFLNTYWQVQWRYNHWYWHHEQAQIWMHINSKYFM